MTIFSSIINENDNTKKSNVNKDISGMSTIPWTVTSGERIEEWQGFTNSQSNEACYVFYAIKVLIFQHFYINISFMSDIQGANVGYNQH